MRNLSLTCALVAASLVSVVRMQVQAQDGFQITGRAQIVDADTIRVEGSPKDIRLFGIDAPERSQLCTEVDGKRFLCGSRAAQALAEILGRNPRVTCRIEDVDRHGRLVSTCRSSGFDISAELVRRGWAVDYTKYSRGRYEAEEEAAREARLGLWGTRDFEMPWDWRAKRREPTPHIIGPR